MRRAASEVLLRTQTFWERFEPAILIALAAAWLLIAVHIGSQRAR